MKFLIAGGAGSVGQALTAFFIQKGHEVRVLDKEADRLQSTGPREPIPRIPPPQKVEIRTKPLTTQRLRLRLRSFMLSPNLNLNLNLCAMLFVA
jgi:nucleoside-diphosphate-sugar epimerase